jgi:hypothetical protein
MDSTLQKFFDSIDNDSDINYELFNAIDVTKAIVYCIENKSNIGICYINKLNDVCAEIGRKLIQTPNDKTLDLLTTIYIVERHQKSFNTDALLAGTVNYKAENKSLFRINFNKALASFFFNFNARFLDDGSFESVNKELINKVEFEYFDDPWTETHILFFKIFQALAQPDSIEIDSEVIKFAKEFVDSTENKKNFIVQGIPNLSKNPDNAFLIASMLLQNIEIDYFK